MLHCKNKADEVVHPRYTVAKRLQWTQTHTAMHWSNDYDLWIWLYPNILINKKKREEEGNTKISVEIHYSLHIIPVQPAVFFNRINPLLKSNITKKKEQKSSSVGTRCTPPPSSACNKPHLMKRSRSCSVPCSYHTYCVHHWTCGSREGGGRRTKRTLLAIYKWA